ncbi:MAG: DUF2218 domain-containing protein [Aliihoeflea sp.]
MAIAIAHVPTANGAKYMTQLCKHWGHKFEVEMTEDSGKIHFPTAAATMQAHAAELEVTVEAEDAETVERMKGVVASHLDRFAFREAPLSFDWS